MEHNGHENLTTLDLAIESLDPSPSELLILFNHMIGRFSWELHEDAWGDALERGCKAVRESRATRP